MGIREEIYKSITDVILKKLDEGIVPWSKPWVEYNGGRMFPANGITRRQYNGINQLMLSCTGYSSPYWLTSKQIANIGGEVKAEQTPMPIVFWKFSKREKTDEGGNVVTDERGNTEFSTSCLMRQYFVYNVEQTTCELAPAPVSPEPEMPSEFEPVALCDKLILSARNMPPVYHKESQAYYSPSFDFINMPVPESFKSKEGYYGTLFHEMTHATGHKSRLKRAGFDGLAMFHRATYAKEELVAEMGAAFLCGITGISNDDATDQSAAYISGWRKAISKDKKLILEAAGAAQKAANYMTSNMDAYVDQRPKGRSASAGAALAQMGL
ncbi:MAG: ArdC family protein [Planctomycetota bacterium]